MKKNTIYTLLCTTILIPSMALGMDEQEKQVPQTPVSRVRAKITEIPKTPDISEIRSQKYPSNIFSPETGNFLADRDRSKISSENALKREKLELEAKTLDFQKRMEKLEKEEEEKREALLRAAQEELAESERKSQELDQEMENARLRAEKAEENLRILTSQLDSLKVEAEQAKLEAEKAAKLESQVESMRLQVEKAETNASLQRDQKIQIRQSAEEDLKRKDERIRQIEALVEDQMSELCETKLKYRKLQLEKESMEELKALKSKSKISTVRSSNPQELSAVVSQQRLPEVDSHTPVPVIVQSQSGSLISDQPSSVGSGVNNSTTTTQKRVAKNPTDTKF